MARKRKRRIPEWLKMFKKIDKGTRKSLGITKKNYEKEFKTELRYIQRKRRGK